MKRKPTTQKTQTPKRNLEPRPLAFAGMLLGLVLLAAGGWFVYQQQAGGSGDGIAPVAQDTAAEIGEAVQAIQDALDDERILDMAAAGLANPDGQDLTQLRRELQRAGVREILDLRLFPPRLENIEIGGYPEPDYTVIDMLFDSRQRESAPTQIHYPGSDDENLAFARAVPGEDGAAGYVFLRVSLDTVTGLIGDPGEGAWLALVQDDRPVMGNADLPADRLFEGTEPIQGTDWTIQWGRISAPGPMASAQALTLAGGGLILIVVGFVFRFRPAREEASESVPVASEPAPAEPEPTRETAGTKAAAAARVPKPARKRTKEPEPDRTNLPDWLLDKGKSDKDLPKSLGAKAGQKAPAESEADDEDTQSGADDETPKVPDVPDLDDILQQIDEPPKADKSERAAADRPEGLDLDYKPSSSPGDHPESEPAEEPEPELNLDAPAELDEPARPDRPPVADTTTDSESTDEGGASGLADVSEDGEESDSETESRERQAASEASDFADVADFAELRDFDDSDEPELMTETDTDAPEIADLPEFGGLDEAEEVEERAASVASGNEAGESEADESQGFAVPEMPDASVEAESPEPSGTAETDEDDFDVPDELKELREITRRQALRAQQEQGQEVEPLDADAAASGPSGDGDDGPLADPEMKLEASEPVESVEAGEITEPVAPADADEGIEASEPEAHSEVDAPVSLDEPDELPETFALDEETETPEREAATEPEIPQEPEAPDEPETLDIPEGPVAVEQPEESEELDEPEALKEPDVPEASEETEAPEQLEAPEELDELDEPEALKEPEVPDAFEEPEAAEVLEAPDDRDEPEVPEASEEPEAPEQLEAPDDRPETPDIFRETEVLGVVDETIDVETATRIGRALGSMAAERGLQRMVVARDGRFSGPILLSALIRGLRSSGVNVIEVGAVPAPLLWFAAAEMSDGSGVMVTGSHHAREYNGFRIMLGGELLDGEGMAELAGRFVAGNVDDDDEEEGEYEQQDIVERYASRLVGDVKLDKALKVVVDCGNGIAGAVAPRLFEAIGADLIPLYCDVDGEFPNHLPDPGKAENLEDLRLCVRNFQAELGIAFDGSGERFAVVTPDGEIQWSDRLLMLLARDVLAGRAGGTVVYDVRCSSHVARVVEDNGGQPSMIASGEPVAGSDRAEGLVLGGTMDGEMVVFDRWYPFYDALYAAARLLAVLAADKRGVDAVFAGLPRFQSTETGIQVGADRARELVRALQSDPGFEDADISTIDGVRADWSDRWGLLRLDPEQGGLALRFGSDSSDALSRVRKDFKTRLLELDPELTLPY